MTKLLTLAGRLLVTLVPLLGVLAVRRWRVERPHGCEMVGGRGGVIRCRVGGRVAEVGWEMLVGDLDLVVYTRSLTWTVPRKAPVGEHEARRILARVYGFLDAARLRYEVD